MMENIDDEADKDRRGIADRYTMLNKTKREIKKKNRERERTVKQKTKKKLGQRTNLIHTLANIERRRKKEKEKRVEKRGECSRVLVENEQKYTYSMCACGSETARVNERMNGRNCIERTNDGKKKRKGRLLCAFSLSHRASSRSGVFHRRVFSTGSQSGKPP